MDSSATSPIPPDLRPYLDTIADRLLSGHAAVMVGAGFSRNAARYGSGPQFPNWSDLGDRFYERLHGRKPEHDRHYLQVPTLAHEIEAAFGRPFLDQMLRDAIPDLQHQPSLLHVTLLDLPWSDVFTTNYDTLLERACRSVISQRYDIVIKPEDLGHSKRPRIVKLHGSFRSNRRLVVTDEDYRRYPHDFAPFVNTVRQTLLENTLCLIGFSGDDPNFLQWIGWIHDNLGQESSPKTYLIGSLSLSHSQKTLLERRNIVPIDLSRCPGVDGDHHRALEWFLEYLQLRRAADNRLDWPSSGEDEATTSDTDDPVKLVKIWKRQRCMYPGWVILPQDCRTALWRKTTDWTRKLPDRDTHSGSLDLEFSFELTWRMERCLCPLFSNQAEFIETTLDRHWPEEDSSASFVLPPDNTSRSTLSKDVVRDMCQYLRLALMRYYREDGLLDKWTDACDKLQAVATNLSPEHAARFHYEQALFALFTLNLQKLKTKLDEWPANDALPLWAARKAGLLAEIGQAGEAQRILEQSLETIRTKLNLSPTKTDYALVSQESFVMFMLHSVRQRLRFRSKNPADTSRQHREFRERWHTLRQYKCDPWHEMELYKHMLGRPPVTRPRLAEIPEFDIGRVVRTSHFGHSDQEALIAFSFLRFCEDAGIPFRIPGLDIGKKSATGTLTRISNYSSHWALVTLVRIGDQNAVDEIFDRTSLVEMDIPSVDNLVERYLESLHAAFPDIETRGHHWDGNFGTLLAEVVPEILSRLCCKCSRAAKYKIIDALLEIYQSEYRWKFKGVRNLTERLLAAFSVNERIAVIPTLLQFPVLTDLGVVEKHEFLNPFYFVDLPSNPTSRNPEIPETALDIFFDKASSDDPVARRWAVTALGTLYDLELLDAARSKQFGAALWCQVGEDGMPSETDYYRNAFLKLPHPVEVDPITLFMQYVRDARFPVQQSGTSIEFGFTGHVSICKAIIASEEIRWSDDDVRSIVRRLVEWWDADKVHLRRIGISLSLLSIADEFKGRLWHLVTTLAFMVVRRSDSMDEGTRKTLERVIEELSEYHLPALRLEMACVSLFPEWRGRIQCRVEDELASTSDEVVVDALDAIQIVGERVAAGTGTKVGGSEKEELMRLIRSVGNTIRWRRDKISSKAIPIVTRMVRTHPWIFVGDIEHSVLLGLHHLKDDTAIHRRSDARSQDTGSRWNVSAKLAVRHAAARLAYSLFEHYRKRGEDVPRAISAWEQVCGSEDEFAEIRNQWPNLMSAAC